MPNSNQNGFLPLKISLHISFFIVGMVTIFLGQIIPILGKSLSLNDEQSGVLFSAQFSGSIIGTISTAFLIRKLGFLKTLGLGFLLFVTGLGGLNLGGYQTTWASIFVYGIGVGLAIPSTLMLTAALNPVKTASALNLMSFAWGIGAIGSQPFVSLFGGATFTIPALILVFISLVFAAIYLIIFKEFGRLQNDLSSETNPPMRIWSNPKSSLIVAFGLCDVGIESGVSGWLTSYSFRSDLPPEISWLSATPIFFTFFVIGRGLAAGLALFLSNNRIIWASLTLTLLGTILLIFSKGWQTIFFSAAILGLGLAAVFPTNMARFTETFGPAANKQTVPLFVMGSVGSITIVWLIGFVSHLYGDSLRAGLGVLLGAAIILLCLQFLFQIQRKQNEPGVNKIEA